MQDVAFNMTVNSESMGVENPTFGGDHLTAEQLAGHNFNKIDGIEKYEFEVNPIYFSIQIHTEYNKVLFQYNSYI